jgi:hypothetical protein
MKRKSRIRAKLITGIFRDWRREGVLDDRREYDREDLKSSMPFLSREEVDVIYGKLHPKIKVPKGWDAKGHPIFNPVRIPKRITKRKKGLSKTQREIRALWKMGHNELGKFIEEEIKKGTWYRASLAQRIYDIRFGPPETGEEAVLREIPNPVQIPERVLAWRETKRRGTIMKPSTFRAIERKAAKGGYAIPSAVGGKAYWVTTLKKYLDEFPGDRTAMKTLNKLLKGRRRNPARSKETLGFRPSRFRSLLKLFSKPAPAYDRGLVKTRVSKSDRDKLIGIVMDTYGISREEAFNRVKQRITSGPYSGYAPADKRNPVKKWYVGVSKKASTGGITKAKVFRSTFKPSLSTHGHLYKFVTGPFKDGVEASNWVAFMGFGLMR